MNRQKEANISKIVDYIIRIGTENTSSGNWHIEYEELSDAFDFATQDFLRRNHETICYELDGREEILSETWTDYDGECQPDGFDCNFALDYCPNADEMEVFA